MCRRTLGFPNSKGYGLQGYNMPGRAAKPCTHPGCRILVRDGGSKCEQHRVAWVKREGPHTAKRLNGWASDKEKARMRRENPLCAHCERVGRVALGVIRDHVVPLAEGGAESRENTQLLCKACHDVKSENERRRGILR